MTETTMTQETEAQFGDYFALLKPRVMSLVIFTAFVGIMVAPGSIHPFIGFFSLLCISIGAGASGALNMWYDEDIDRVMSRTQKRPIPSGRVTGYDALAIGVFLSAMSVMMLALASNLLAAGLLAFTIFFYAVIYTMWLKRSTPQNIVIGGAAGAFPPMIGWAVVTGDVTITSVLLFMLIFMWTPPHFWALALFMNDDYEKAQVPMLPVTHGTRSTRVHILVYTVILALSAGGLAFTEIAGWAYWATALVLNGLFLIGAVQLWRRTDADAAADNHQAERKFFKLSLYYLFVHFLALLVDAVLSAWGIY